jgi:hypothetical protein
VMVPVLEAVAIAAFAVFAAVIVAFLLLRD